MPYSIGKGRELYAAGKLHGQWPASELLDLVGSLQAFRDSLKPKQQKIRKIRIAAIFGIIIFAILAFAMSDSPICLIWVALSLASIVLLVISIVRSVRLKSDKFNPDAASVIGPLIQCITPDLAKNTPVTVNASLRSPFEKEFLVKEGQKYSTFAYSECVDKFYKRPVLNLTCRISDGTRLMAGIVEHSIEKVLKKKNPRGKWKTKKKYRRKLGVRVRIQLDKTQTRVTGQFKLPADAQVRHRESPRGDVILVSLSKTVKDTSPLKASLLLDLMAGAYKAVAPVSNGQTQPGGKL